MKKYTFLLFVFAAIFNTTYAQVKNVQDYFNKTDKFLVANVKDGKVNYKGINTNRSEERRVGKEC